MNLDRIFNSFDNENYNSDDESSLLVDFSEHPLYWIGGFNKIIFIEPITQIRGEYELLIPPDTEFRILKHEEFKKETTFDYDHIKGQGEDKKYKLYYSFIQLLFCSYTRLSALSL